jgi:DNA-binding response OmpR family regulator
VTKSSPQFASGQEVLVVDKDEKVTRGMETVLAKLGLVVTATADPIRAQDLLINKFFAVGLFDIDTPTTGAGLELLRFARDKSPLTTILMMTARKAFDIGVAGFRGGATDVVVKEPDSVPYLKDRVVAAANELIANSDRNTLLEEVVDLHEDFLRRMRDMSRQNVDLEDRLLGRANVSGGAGDTCSIVLVDDDPGVAKAFDALFPEAKGWRITAALTGGEGLDFAAEFRPQIVLVKDPLPDLPARMVTGNVKKLSPDSIAIVYQYDRPAAPGEVTLVEGSRPMLLLSSYTGPEQLVSVLAEVREGIRQKLKERRYLQVFRQTHLEFLNRYNNVRQRVQAVIARAKK